MYFLKKRYEKLDIDYIVGLDARGFIFGSALSVMLGIGFVPIRKKGKLPAEVYSKEYNLEYGTDTLEIHKDAFCGKKDAKVIMIDDLLATGGTAMCALELIDKAGGNVVESCFIIYLEFLKSKELFKNKCKVFTIINV
jgi:adenine phosphoribosyltransferase